MTALSQRRAQVRRHVGDPDRFLGYYNLRRSYQGYRLQGQTPALWAKDRTYQEMFDQA